MFRVDVQPGYRGLISNSAQATTLLSPLLQDALFLFWLFWLKSLPPRQDEPNMNLTPVLHTWDQDAAYDAAPPTNKQRPSHAFASLITCVNLCQNIIIVLVELVVLYSSICSTI